MKKVFQTKLKNITKVLALVIVAGLATFTGCKSYDSDISQLNTDIATLRTDLTTQMNTLNSATTTAVNAQIATLTAQLTADEAKITALQTSSTAQAAQITALQASIVTNTASIAALQAFQTSAAADIATLKTQMAATAKQADLLALQTTVNSFITSTNTTLTALGARVTTVETNLTTAQTNIATLQGNVAAQLLLINGLQTAVDALQTTTTAQGTAITALQTTVTSQGVSITALQTSVASQLVLINANTTAIANLRTDLTALQTSVGTLQTTVNTTNATNTTAIAANTAAIAALQTKLTTVTANFRAIASAMSLDFAALSSRLTSLEFVADFNVNGIAAMNFSPLTSQCNAITPSVTVAYHLNPSFITAADIETGNMSFVVLPTSNIIYTGLQTAKAVADAPKIRAIFNKIQDGKIYVDVKVDDITVLASTLGLYGSNALMETFNSIALQVPLSQKAVQENAITFDANDGVVVVGSTTYPTNRVITSAYVRLFSQNILASNINLVRPIKLTSPVNVPAYPKTLAGAEALPVTGIDGASTTDPTVVELPYGQTLDLVTQVLAWYNGAAFDVAKYGLNFKFDLLDASGNVIVYKRGSNQTDQQQFIQINDAAKGTIQAKTFTQQIIDAAQGRTPIVRVTMYNDQQPTCSVLMAFIKIHIADKPLPVDVNIVPPFTTPDSVATCMGAMRTLTVQEVNEKIYNDPGVLLSKTNFNLIYPTLVKVSGTGTVTQIASPDAQSTDTWLPRWSITAQDIWAALQATTNSSVTFTLKAEYVSNMPTLYPNVFITFTRTITKPSTLNLATIISNYWYTDATKSLYPYVKHNVYVPDVNEAVTTRCLFFNNINQAFEQNADHSLKLATGLTNYQYYFLATQPTLTGPTGNVTLTPSSDGQTLLNGSEIVATINPFATGVGDVLVLNQSSAMAKKLLNYTADPAATKGENLVARLGIRTTVCSDLRIVMPVTVNGNPWFDVVFVRPINAQPGSGQHFVDALNFGDPYTYIDIAKLVNLFDWRYNDPVASFATHANYYGYYGVTAITADVANITTNLNQTGTTRVPLAQYPDVRVAWAASIAGVTPVGAYGYLTYNNTGNTLDNPFSLYVPVTITYYWGQIVSATIEVPVWKTVGGSGVKALR
jgi:hypothetical protein